MHVPLESVRWDRQPKPMLPEGYDISRQV